MKRWWLKLLIALVVFGILLWLSFLGYGSHSRKDLEEYQAQLRRAGEKLDVSELGLPPIPREQNALDSFRVVEHLMTLNFRDVVSTNPPTAMQMIAPGRAMVGWQQPEIRGDFATNTWAELRADLGRLDAALEFLREVPAKSRLQFDLDYSKGFDLLLPYLSPMKHSANLANAAVLCDLHEGNWDSAATNLHGALVLVRIWDREPLLISQLVRMAMLQIAFGIQWELLQTTNISPRNLAQLQSDWERLDLLESMEAALVGERVLSSLTIERWRGSNSPPDFSASGGISPGGTGDLWEDLKDHGRAVRGNFNFATWRSSWSFSDQLFILKADQVLLTALREIRTNGFYKDALARSEREAETMMTEYRRANRVRLWMKDETGNAIASPPALHGGLKRLLVIEAARNLAITAVALKRFELAHHQFPERLDSLTPEFLSEVPRDPVDGKMLRYRRNPDGTFLLYSIGANAMDDGGSGSSTARSKSFSWQNGIDWAWPQPATSAEAEAFPLLRGRAK